MTRIISGRVGSLRLKAAPKGTRPTSDRVKESVFSILESMSALEDAIVLDLYAGTGALGLESASRGARSVALVESGVAAAKVCAENLQAVQVGLKKQGSETALMLYQEPVARFLKRNQQATLVFMDPPYELENQVVLEQLELLSSQDALIVLERSAKADPLQLPDNLELLAAKSYGDTRIYMISTRFAG